MILQTARIAINNHAESVYVATGMIEQIIWDERTKYCIQTNLYAGDAAIINKGAIHSAKPLRPNIEVIVTLLGEGDAYEAEDQPKIK